MNFIGNRFGTSIWDRFGPRFGVRFEPNMDENSLGIPLGAVRGPLGQIFFGSRALQERSDSPPRGERPPEQILDPSL